MRNRLRCALYGCAQDDGLYICGRCYAYPGSERWIERGWLPWWCTRYALWEWLAGCLEELRRWVWPRCQECRRHLWPWRHYRARRAGFDANFCSTKCYNVYLPF